MVNFLNVTVEEHGWKINWEYASGDMESGMSLELCITLHDESNHSIFVEYIVLDNDITMCVHLTHYGKGVTPTHIPLPIFLADPS